MNFCLPSLFRRRPVHPQQIHSLYFAGQVYYNLAEDIKKARNKKDVWQIGCQKWLMLPMTPLLKLNRAQFKTRPLKHWQKSLKH